MVLLLLTVNYWLFILLTQTDIINCYCWLLLLLLLLLNDYCVTLLLVWLIGQLLLLLIDWTLLIVIVIVDWIVGELILLRIVIDCWYYCFIVDCWLLIDCYCWYCYYCVLLLLLLLIIVIEVIVVMIGWPIGIVIGIGNYYWLLLLLRLTHLIVDGWIVVLLRLYCYCVIDCYWMDPIIVTRPIVDWLTLLTDLLLFIVIDRPLTQLWCWLLTVVLC